MTGTTFRASAGVAAAGQLPTAVGDGAQDVSALPLDTIERARRYFDSARAAHTLRTYHSGWLAFVCWAERQGVQALPAAPATVAAFAAAAAESRYKPATIKNRLSAIAAVHRRDGHTNPCDAQAVRAVVKGISRTHGTRQAQARGLTDRDTAKIEVQLGNNIRDLRDHAMLLVARDLLARRGELVALNLDDMAFTSDGDGTAMIRRSKTDQEGEGAVGYLSPAAVAQTLPVRRGSRKAPFSGASATVNALAIARTSDLFNAASSGWPSAPASMRRESPGTVRVSG